MNYAQIGHPNMQYPIHHTEKITNPTCPTQSDSIWSGFDFKLTIRLRPIYPILQDSVDEEDSSNFVNRIWYKQMDNILVFQIASKYVSKPISDCKSCAFEIVPSFCLRASIEAIK